ncbi:MAG: PIN domain-containing protein [Sphingomonadales bacterium BRH_c42]|nr:MAG: PIN domain-containing protein [Sphingomonadales bacterium BRH_c42]
MSLVLDASVAIAWLFEDEASEGLQQVLRKVATDGAIVPSLWRLEVANVLRNAVRRGRCNEDYVDQSLARLDRLPLAIDEETDSRAWGATLDLARAEDLTLYDAAYLELAERRGRPLATCDAALAKAAARRGVEILTS